MNAANVYTSRRMNSIKKDDECICVYILMSENLSMLNMWKHKCMHEIRVYMDELEYMYTYAYRWTLMHMYIQRIKSF